MISEVILLDFSGHPFQIQLARHLAAKEYKTHFLYSQDYISGKGSFKTNEIGKKHLLIIPIHCKRELKKYNFFNRFLFEIEFSIRSAKIVNRINSKKIILCNVPIISLFLLNIFTRKKKIIWHQDIYSIAIASELNKNTNLLKKILTYIFIQMEKKILKDSEFIIGITEEFRKIYKFWQIPEDKIRIIENWAPLDEIRSVPRSDNWLKSKGITTNGLRLLYAGTLGRKHNPEHLISLMDHLRNLGRVASLTVISEGEGREILECKTLERSDFLFFDFQPYENMSEIFASHDISLVLLEEDASKYSVPSKVLSYVAAGKAVAGIIPNSNLATEVIRKSAGMVGEPNLNGIKILAKWISELSEKDIEKIGYQARKYAELTFDISLKADKFMEILEK